MIEANTSIYNPPPDTPEMPAHRSREANPLVKMVDDFDVMENAIATKSSASRFNAEASSSSTKHRKPGPGRNSGTLPEKNRSSLLTFEKGALKTVKGKYTKQKNAQIEPLVANEVSPDVQPSADELLILAGLQGDEPIVLDDFEEVEGDASANQSDDRNDSMLKKRFGLQYCERERNSSHFSLDMAKNALFPAIASSVSDAFNTVWKRPTIFGPL
jgi:hypothetical protein